MPRDRKYMKDLLLQIDAGKMTFNVLSKNVASALGLDPDDALSEEDARKLETHLDLLKEEGLIEILFRSGGGQVTIKRITSRGHDFIERN